MNDSLKSILCHESLLCYDDSSCNNDHLFSFIYFILHYILISIGQDKTDKKDEKDKTDEKDGKDENDHSVATSYKIIT